MNVRGIVLGGAFIFLSACGKGHPDLGGGYYLDDDDPHRVSVVRALEKAEEMAIPPYVVSYKKISRHEYVIKQMVGVSYDCVDSKRKSSIRTIYTARSNYWVLNTETGSARMVDRDAEKLGGGEFLAMFPYVIDDGREQKVLSTMISCKKI